MAGGDDRLSALSDDFLQRILHLLPSKEAASTSVLSRRWGSLWRSSGAVNLAVRVPGYQRLNVGRSNDPWGSNYYGRREAEDTTAFVSCQEAFVRAAGAALAAAVAPVTRLTLRVETDADRSLITHFLHRGTDWSTHGNLADALLSHPKAAHVEELRVALVKITPDACDLPDTEVHKAQGLYKPVSLPSSETLRVLDLTSCDLAAPAVFPRLVTLRLRLCSFQLKDLQDLFDAAPELATVHLESVFFTLPPDSQQYRTFHYPSYPGQSMPDGNTAAEPVVLGLRFRAVMTLVLASCGLEVARDYRGNIGGWTIEIDAPRLRSFAYKGFLRRFLLRSPAPDLALVDLHFLNVSPDKLDGYRRGDNDREGTRMLFWQFLHNFTNSRALKLKVNCDFKDIAAIGGARRAELLRTFPNAERLELEGVYRPSSKTAGVAIANMLHCCPLVRDLTLKLSTVPPHSQKPPDYGRPFLERKDRLDYSKSIDRFNRRSSKMTIAVEDSSCDGYDGVPDIPGLSGHSFACLQSSLRRVSLQFRLGDSISSCFGRQLIKFFAENAMGLEEMCVDSGNRRLYEHFNFNVSTKAWFEHRNLAEGSCEFSRIPSVSLESTTDDGRSRSGFAVLSLRR